VHEGAKNYSKRLEEEIDQNIIACFNNSDDVYRAMREKHGMVSNAGGKVLTVTPLI
jgi:hypothetical protein